MKNKELVTTCYWLLSNVRGFSKQHRTIYQYGVYPTPAKGPVGLLDKTATQLDWVQHYEKNIVYHAAWRAHLYFLLLIAYQGQQRAVQLGKTVLQHGSGVYPHLQACHSSFFPSLIDSSPANVGIVKSSIIEKSFFNHWNNMTVCCPSVVNQVDQFFEGYNRLGIYRKNLLLILSLVSMGSHDSFTGLQQFFQLMNIAFEDSQILIKKQENRDATKVVRHVIDLQRHGMFRTVSACDYSPVNGYFNCVLGRKPYESLDSACKRTQSKLLNGSMDEGRLFLEEIQTAAPGLRN